MPPPTPQKGILKDIASLLASEKYSDLTVTCGSRTFKVHRAIICPAVGILHRSLRRIIQGKITSKAIEILRIISSCKKANGGMPVSFFLIMKVLSQESSTGTIDLPDDDPESIARTISFFYTSEYEPASPSDVASGNTPNSTKSVPKKKQPAKSSRVTRSKVVKVSSIATVSKAEKEKQAAALESAIIHASMYAMGEKFIVSELKDLAKEKFCNFLKENDGWVFGIPELLRLIYTSTPCTDKGLREPFSVACAEVFAFGTVENEEQCREVFEEIPEALIDLCIVCKDRVNTQFATLEKEKKDLTMEVDELKTEIRCLETTNARLSAEKRSAELKVAELEGQLKTQKRKNGWGGH